MPPTLVAHEGFETQYNATQAVPAGTALYVTIGRAAGTSYVTGRRGGYAIRLDGDATTATNVRQDYTGAQTRCFAGWFRITDVSVDASRIIVFRDAGTTNMAYFDVRNAANGGTIRARAGGGTVQTGPRVDDGLWHKLECKLVFTGATWTVDWRVDNIAQTQATEGSHVATDQVRTLFGSDSASHNMTVDWDDCLISATADDYDSRNWGYDWQIVSSIPDGIGSSTLGSSNPIVDEAGAQASLNTKVDEWPPNESDYITYTSTTLGDAASNFVDLTMTDRPGGYYTVWAVMGYAACFAAGTTANNLTVRVVDSGGTTLTNIVAGDVSETSLRCWRGLITEPAGGWSAGFNGAKVRPGFSSDTSPLPRCSAVMLTAACPVDPWGMGTLKE